jgi:carboxypeptidase Q
VAFSVFVVHWSAPMSRTKIHLLCFCLVIGLCHARQAVAQTKAPSLPPELAKDLAALRDAAMASDYAYRQIAHLTENIGPRPVGSPQAEAAVQYVAGQLRELGLEVRLEEVRAPRWVRGLETAELVDYSGHVTGTAQKVVVTALGGNSPTSNDGITAEVVVVRSFTELEALGSRAVSGKIVLFNVAFDKKKAASGYAGEAYDESVIYRGQGALRAKALGAAAALVRSVGGADYRIPHTGGSRAAGIPAGAVTAEDADLIADLSSQGAVRMHLVLTGVMREDVKTFNVVADLKGTEHPEQIVVVSGHLDSWDLGTGAIDDAAGVGVAMEAARIVQQLNLHPRRTLRVIAWMDEENFGRGHEAYARAHSAEMQNHVGAIESDLGAGHPMGVDAHVAIAARDRLKPIMQILEPIGANLIHSEEGSPGADIEPLVSAGVPGFGILQDARTYFNYHHTPADTLDKIVPRELQENAAVMAVLGYALAEMPEPLPRQ